MKFLSLIFALLIIGFILTQQMGGGSDPSTQATRSTENSGPPQVPNAPQGVNQFGKDMEGYLKDTAAERAENIKDAESN